MWDGCLSCNRKLADCFCPVDYAHFTELLREYEYDNDIGAPIDLPVDAKENASFKAGYQAGLQVAYRALVRRAQALLSETEGQYLGSKQTALAGELLAAANELVKEKKT